MTFLAPLRSAAARLRSPLLALPLLAAALSCGNTFEPASSIRSLRILGVRAAEPYGKPGATNKLQMLVYDGSPRAFDAKGARTRAVETIWIGGCHNPPGDLYFGCFPILAQQFAQLGGSIPGGAGGAPAGPPPGGLGAALEFLGTGLKFDLKIPADIVSRRPAEEVAKLVAEGNVPYGLSYVFYAACGGTLKPVPLDQATNGLPLGCFDKTTGEQLGSDDFVVGYTPLYTYEKFSNKNPVVDGMTFEGAPSMNKACDAATPCGAGQRCGSQGVCLPVVPHCAERKTIDCTKYKIKPTLSQAKNIEKDEVAPEQDGRKPDEIIWAAYYTTDGNIERDLVLVNDANKGWNDEHGIEWTAPNAPAGESRVWVVIHDNRGGTTWAWQDLFVD